MEKRQAQDYIKEVLKQPFDQERFGLFIRNLLNDIELKDNRYSGNLIPEAFRDHISYYKRIGKYTDPEGEQLDILIIQTRSVKKLERTRTALRNFVVRHLKTFDKQYALAAFYSKEDDGAEWRFSLVKIEYETKKSSDEKIKIEEELVPAKRYSFLVGKYENAHTAQKQLLPILTNDHINPLIVKETDGDGSIEGAFSIQKVTDEFYEQYKELYLKLAENESLSIALKKEDLNVDRFVKKLLGQIVFLYFLQKKGWLGVLKDQKMGEGSKRFLQERFELAVHNDENFYNVFLRYLFYEALAREHNDEGIKYYFRKLGCRIPFLNGGLFEADFNWQHAAFSIPNELFSNDEKNKAGDKGTGILNVFDRYNFTIKEDEPLEKEVAVDPEMLGKVFENMLEIKERKSKGAYYTPREIVHYMCQESLIHYLDNSVNDYTECYQTLGNNQSSMFGGSTDKIGNLSLEIKHKGEVRCPKEDIKILIRNGHLLLENEAIALDAKKRIEDGEIKSTKHKSILPDSISNNAKQLDDALKSIKICDPAIGSGAFPVGLLHEIVTTRQVLNSFLQRDGYSSYNLKRHAIQESIYGVDVDASAIDIARLRLWLSMIVEEEDYDTIEALPNLDYKIVNGNSLVGLPENSMRSLKVEKELENLKESFFSETDEEIKKKLRIDINSKIRELLDSAEEFVGYKIDFDFKFFFSEIWHLKGGFDVVIGNPPYVDIKQLPKKAVNFLMEHYDTTQNRINLYSIFIEKGLSICHNKGALIFINPNSMLLNSSYKILREKIIDKLLKVIKLPNNVFEEAIVETIIIHISKKESHTSVLGAYYKRDDHIDFSSLKFLTFDENIWKRDPDKRINIFATPEQLSLVLDIERKNKKLGEYFDVCLGLTPYDKYKGHTPDQIKNRVYHSKTKKDNSYVPLLSGSNIKRFSIDHKSIKEFIKYGQWLGAPRQEKFFTEPRVIVRQIVSGTPLRIYAGCTAMSLYHTQIAFSIISTDKSPFSTKTLCAYLNSDILNFYHKYKYLDIEKDTFQKILIENCKSFPLPDIDNKHEKIINNIVDYLIYLNNKINSIEFRFFDKINNLIFFELFFNEAISKANKSCLSYLDDLKPIDTIISNEEKYSIIKSEFERLHHPNHPLRNILETIDSIEEVKIIKEALK